MEQGKKKLNKFNSWIILKYLNLKLILFHCEYIIFIYFKKIIKIRIDLIFF